MAGLRLAGTTIGALVIVVGCSGDLFHSTKWASLCDTEPGTCGGGGAGATSTANGHPGASSTGAGAAGGNGGGPSSGGGPSASSGSATSSNASTGSGNPTCNGNEVQDPASRHCFEFVAVATPWGEALSDCQQKGGSLASIGSAGENAFVLGLTGPSSWIGGTDAASEGTWVWANGDLWIYTNWNALEPNNSGGIENCLELYGSASSAAGFWNDLDCATVLPHVCERVP